MTFRVLNCNLYDVIMANTYTLTSPLDAALTPPPSVLPDFDDPFSLRPYWNVTVALGIIVTAFFLTLRIYTKLYIVKKIRWEDCRASSEDPIKQRS